MSISSTKEHSFIFPVSPHPQHTLSAFRVWYFPSGSQQCFYIIFLGLWSTAVLLVKPGLPVTRVPSWASGVSIFHVTPDPVLT